MAERHLRCYIHGKGTTWEAICIDLDIAVQGSSMQEVKNLLGEAISSYVADACKEDPETAERLLSRRAPFWVRAKLGLNLLTYSLASQRRNGDHSSHFEMPCRA